MIRETKKKEEPVEEEMTLADIVENEEDKKILEPVVEKKVEKSGSYIMGFAIKDGVLVRAKPDKNSEIIYILKQGEAMIINHEMDTDDYYYGSVKSVVGYALKSDISLG